MSTTQQEIATPDSVNTVSRKVRSQSLKFGTTKWLTYTALFAALALALKVLGQFMTLTDSFKITLIYVVWLIAAAVVGPVGGAIVCLTSDLLGAVILPMGVLNPLLTIGYVLYGVIAGLCFKYLPVKNYVSKFIISGIICEFLITMFFSTFAIWIWCRYYLKLNSYLSNSLWVYLAVNRVWQLVVCTINIAITVALIPLLKRLRLLPPIDKKSNLIKENVNA